MEYGRTTYSLRNKNTHTNLSEMMQIIKILIDMNFRIDVCGCDNEEAIPEMPQNYYDYILGFGKMYKYAKKVNPQAFSILYMTETPYYISFKSEQERIDYYYQRHGKRMPMVRTGKFYSQGDECDADAIICMGEKNIWIILENLYLGYTQLDLFVMITQMIQRKEEKTIL